MLADFGGKATWDADLFPLEKELNRLADERGVKLMVGGWGIGSEEIGSVNRRSYLNAGFVRSPRASRVPQFEHSPVAVASIPRSESKTLIGVLSRRRWQVAIPGEVQKYARYTSRSQPARSLPVPMADQVHRPQITTQDHRARQEQIYRG